MNQDDIKRMSQNGWHEYKIYILKSIETINGTTMDISKDIHKLQMEISGLKAKSHVWGAIAGTAASIIVGIVSFFVIKGLGG